MMKPAQLRAWIRKYGGWGYLLVGLYLCFYHFRQNRRASFTACAASLVLVIGGLWWWQAQAKPKQIEGHPLHLGTNKRQAMQLSSAKPASRAQTDRASKNFKPTIRLTKDRPFEVRLTVLDGKRVVWHAELGANYEACVFPKDRMVVYFEQDTGLIARRFDGTTVWKLPDELRSPHLVIASGSYLIFSWLGATPGHYSSMKDIIGWVNYGILDVHTGKLLWNDDEVTAYSIGVPCWINDRVVADIREEFVNPQATAFDPVSGEENDHCSDGSTWIEVRRLRDHAVLWRRRYNGSSNNVSLQRVNTRQLKVCYKLSSGDATKRPHPSRMKLLVPIRRRRAEAQEQAPILYTVPSDD